jgi:hypothetical protein
MKIHFYPILIILIAALGLSSCTQSTQEAAPVEATAETPQKKKPLRPRLTKREGRPLYRIESPQHFSEVKLPDKFVLELDGPSVIKGEVAFTITTFAGKELYRETFPATALIDKGCEAPASDTLEQEYYIIQRIKGFFVNGNYELPAINPGSKFDPKVSEKALWKEIEGDSTAISFYYLLGETDAKEIVWSKKKKKVMVLKDF